MTNACWRNALAGMIAVAALFSQPSLAQTEADRTNACTTGSGEEAIAGCTWILQSGANLSNLQRAYVYFLRGTSYQLKGRLDSAIEDFNDAIALNPRDAKSFE